MSAITALRSIGKFADKRTLRKRKGVVIAVASIAMVAWATPLGLLLWARIRILTSIPKTAIADDTLAYAPRVEPPIELDPALPGSDATLRDPFHIDARVFPDPRAVAAAAPSAQRASVAVASAPEVQVDAQSAVDSVSTEQSQLELVRLSAEAFRVQSAGAGLLIAVVDDRPRRIGDVLVSGDGRSFTLVRVIDHGIVLSHEGHEIVVRMPIDGSGTFEPGKRASDAADQSRDVAAEAGRRQ